MEKIHPIEFPIIEKRLLREVVTEIERVENQYPGVTPHGIMKKYEAVKKFYDEQRYDEEYLMSTFGPAPGIGQKS